MAKCSAVKKKHLPGCETTGEEIFDFPFLKDNKTIEFIENHGKIMFIIRGPPGTAKGTLSKLFCDTFPKGVTCSADAYFSKPFVAKTRDKTSLKQSHIFCQKRVTEECEKRTNPIIVQNTHMKKWEVDVYLNFAKQYNYTVIMAITLRKFNVNAEILEETNTKHLSKSYLQKRLASWEEYIPIYLGWFLCPDDRLFVIQQAKCALQHLLDNKQFCAVTNASCDEEIWSQYIVEERLYCLASHCENKFSGQHPFYLSDGVQDVYGKHFKFTIQGFVINREAVYAVAAVTENMEHLITAKPGKSAADASTEDDLSDLFGSMRIVTREKGPKTFKENFSSNGKTAVLDTCPDGEFNAALLSYVLIAQSRRLQNPDLDVKKFTELFLNVTNDNNAIENSKFSGLKDGMKYIKLSRESWFFLLKEQITLSSILTGMYK